MKELEKIKNKIRDLKYLLDNSKELNDIEFLKGGIYYLSWVIKEE